MTIFTSTSFEHVSDDFSFSSLRISFYLFERKKEDRHTRLRENEDLPLWEAPVLRQKPSCLYVRALIKLITKEKPFKYSSNGTSRLGTEWGGKGV